MLYSKLIKPLLFNFDSERVHDALMQLGKLSEFAPLYQLLRLLYQCQNQRLEVELAGLKFPNRLGLAAGFDKNCSAPWLFEALGFGHIEFGTVTSKAQVGNPKPRIFRLEQDRALINRMGFPSLGAELVAARLARFRKADPRSRIGINIGKLKDVPLEEAQQNYLEVFKRLEGLGDYYVLNVSSPNTPELRKLQERSRLEGLFKSLQAANRQGAPLFVKIAPDLSLAELDDVLSVCIDQKLSGVIATNTTLSREGLLSNPDQAGGLSGEPLFSRSLNFVQHIFKTAGDKLALIGVGGVSSADHVLKMIDAGASLVQIYTGLIYQGPALVRNINAALLQASQFK